MQYDFDRPIDRRGTGSVKYDSAAACGLPHDVLPLWVADMDFAAPPCVLDALAARCAHGIFGYSAPDDDYFETLRRWFARRMDWAIQPDWVVQSPGIVTALHVAICALTAPGDGVLIQPPVYPPFAHAVESTGRTPVENPLVSLGGRYEIDFDDFARKAASPRVKLFILCSPHNPVGRVWSREELTRMGEICLANGVLVVADEIHQDFVWPGRRHHVFASLSPAFLDNSVTCTAPSKTFNLAGLQISNLMIANPQLREAFLREYGRFGLGGVGVAGLVACKAAYGGGEDWLAQLLAYLNENLAFLRGFLRARLPQIALTEPEGTYLAWLDFRALGLDKPALDELLTQQAKLWLNDGADFGTGGEGFYRLNLACTRATLTEALERLANALSERERDAL